MVKELKNKILGFRLSCQNIKTKNKYLYIYSFKKDKYLHVYKLLYYNRTKLYRYNLLRKM